MATAESPPAVVLLAIAAVKLAAVGSVFAEPAATVVLVVAAEEFVAYLLAAVDELAAGQVVSIAAGDSAAAAGLVSLGLVVGMIAVAEAFRRWVV